MARFIERLFASNVGSVLPIAAASVPVIVALIGGGLDINRVYKARNRLQSASDAGTLAGRRAVTTNGYDAAARNQANAYFNTNFVEGELGATGTTFTTASTNGGNLISGTAATTVQTAVMNLLGVDTIPVSVACSATMGVGNSDITMVLDTTGSMGNTLSGTSQTRIQALRVAMKNFYDTVATATQGSNARIRYSFVPYSSSVNVGRLIYNLNPAYLADTWPIQTREPVFNTITEQVFTGWSAAVNTSEQTYSTETIGSTSQHSSTNYNSQATCNNARPADVAWANNGSATSSSSTTTNGAGQQVVTTTTTQPQRKTTYVCQLQSSNRWRVFYYYTTRNFITRNYATSDPIYETRTRQEFSNWAYRQVSNVDTSVYKTFTAVSKPNGSNGTAASYTWGGCIEERESDATSSISYSSVTGMSPSTALDLDVDLVPDGNPETKWGPMWPELAYYRTTTVWGTTYLTDAVQTSQGSKASSYCPHQAQLLSTMNQSAFYSYADALAAAGSTYHDLGMLWGLRLSSPQGPWADTVNIAPTNGGKVSRHIIFMTDGQMEPSTTIQSSYGIEWHDRRITDDGSSNQAARHTLRFRALCDNAKDKGFRVWVIAFASSLTSDLTYCASSNSSFLATNATQLNSAFQEIAKNVGELRVYQ
ncbi:TadE/TadG family type IV pilus assembly protein [Novosphingobium sp. ES2-1]|uniref:TadE/TadG family type IV pilus assembly protein n=1 Tax=Novosphingobium sp. ES2-1 TaxID=2780074 RepID=UPI0018821C9D|nr:pilus assembly protein TadG-related protein [Novosphingobium sp. ES2-1]QOV94822.1 pilus assembly protein TadG [Novosphingobium sp. ES2-1]